ncbi:MAG: VWA domain-containing protein, partial [Fibrobacteres bacterium]|nr:VWA domain-containing protein [Fibrobacterota bacterium]
MEKTKTLLTAALISLFVMPVILFSQSDTAARIWVSRSISTDTVFYEGAPANSRTTVNLKAWASGESTFVGLPIDVAIITDNSTSMQEPTSRPRNPGDRNWLTPNRIQGTFNASVNFVDSFMNLNDRIAHLRFGGFVVTPQTFTGNFVAAKARMDSTINGRGSFVNGRWTADGTAVWDGILAGIRYVLANKRPNITSVIIALTDGEDNQSRTTPNNIIRVLDSIRVALGPTAIRVFTINLGTNSNSTPMRNIAAAGGGSWAYSATGTDLDAIFQGIGQRLSDVVGRSITPGAPVLIDVLGPAIHYVPGSFTYRSGLGFVRPSFTIDTVNGFTRLSFGADTIRLEQFLDIQYQITAEMAKPDIFRDSLMRTNNTFGDAANYSIVQYRNIKDTIISRPIERNWINVRSGIGGLFLSESLTTIVPASPTKLIPLIYSFSTSATYPSRTFYALLQQLASNSVKLSAVNSQWYFQPNAGWTAPMYNGVSASSRDVGITVPFDYSDNDTLSISFSHRNTQYGDYLVFSASDSSSPEQIVSIGIDNDTNTAGFIDPPRIVITGNRTQLNAISLPLFARSLSNRNSVLPITATWSTEQFGLSASYLNTVFQGNHSQRTLSPNLPVTNFSQSDSGIIRITGQGLSFDLKLVIKDTTNYDTSDVLVLYDSLYGNYSPYIEAAFPIQSARNYLNANLGDTLRLYALRFDSNGTVMK